MNDVRTERARRLRRDQTAAERILWRRLRDRQIGGRKWRRQVPVDNYIVDFMCPELRLVVELDGDMHAGREREDQERQEYLTAQGFTVLRYTNEDVKHNPDGVLSVIWQIGEGR